MASAHTSQERPLRLTTPVESKFPRKGSVRRIGLEEPEMSSPMINLQDADEVKESNQEMKLNARNAERVPERSLLCPWRRQRRQRKPPSNPPGWSEGKSSVYDMAQHPNRIVIINGNQENDFVSNMVRTAKYEYYDFLPRFLWEEFNPATKIANVYFLFIAALQVIPSITNTFGIPLMLLPLFFVVCVDAIFMIFEDVSRHRADKYANASLTRAWDRRSGEFKHIAWREIEVGDLIVINNREAVPCDILIMGVDEPIPQSPAGVAYVETKSLDGETNLKIRQVVKGVVGKLVTPEDCGSLAGRVVMEHPNKLINNFKGKLLLLDKHRRKSSASTSRRGSRGRRNSGRRGSQGVTSGSGGDGNVSGEGDPEAGMAEGGPVEYLGGTRTQGSAASEPISADMLLLRGCVLRNTRWVLGLVLNTGPDTKIMMSMSKAPSKASHLSSRINEEIKRVAAVMGSVCLLGALLTTLWNAKYQKTKGYLLFDGNSDDRLTGMFFTQFLYNALLLNSFIPISLYVSMNFVRFLQAWFMNQDLEMYHAESDTPARVRTMNLNEDLGQVSHIFSDKTGTLTCNIMDFRKFSVGGVSYGLGITEIGRAAMVVEGEEVPDDVLKAEEKAKDHAAPHVNFYDPSVYKDLQGQEPGGQEQADRIRDFFTALALCHTVIPERFEDTDEVILSASSPDDEALVLGAKYFGFEFVNRIDSSAILHTWDVTAPPPSTPPSSATRATAATVGATTATAAASSAVDVSHSPVDSAGVVVCGNQGDRQGTGGDGAGPGDAASEAVAGVRVEEGGDVRCKSEVSRVSYEVLHVLGFTSDRKRMSVIVRTVDGTVKIICKGADTTMLPRLRKDYPGAKECVEDTVKHMDVFAREGLRTLVVAQAELDPVAFQKWERDFEKASNDLEEIDKRNMGEPNRIEGCMELIETNLEIIGASAIEDKLQAGVAGAVSDLMAAGIKIWVLTGDKEETAINIAVACQLLWTEARMHRTVINLRGTGESETDEITQALEDFLSKCIEERNRFEQDETGKVAPPLPRGLVIDGPALLEAMQTPESQGALLRAAQTCHSVIGCRLSPDQKRALVALVRENVPGTRTLSIGDGANDVPMIQRAHIGVGISGQEGMQAVNASDYAVAQFAYLRKLLLVHGRWNYRRSSRVVCYLFYKSVMFACPLIFYAYNNGYSGTLFYDYVTCNMYAIVYTALPILLYGTYDRDISAETCLRYPQLYAYGITDRCMRPTIFWSWMLQAVVESAFLTFAPILLLSGDVDGMGVVTSAYDYGTLTFALVVIQVTFKMFWVQYRWTRLHVLVLASSIFAFFLSAFLVNAWIPINWDYHGVVNALFRSKPYWAVTVWCLTVVVGRDWTSKFHHRWWRPRLHHLMLESDKRLMVEQARQAKGFKIAYGSEGDDKKGSIEGGGGGGGGGSALGDFEVAMTPPPTSTHQQQAAHAACTSTTSDGAIGASDADSPDKDTPRSPSTAYAGLFHRREHHRSNTTGHQHHQQEHPTEQEDQDRLTVHANDEDDDDYLTPTPGLLRHQRRHRHRRPILGRSGTASYLEGDGSDVSVGGLLECTFSPAAARHRAGGSFGVSPVPMNALSETLRERRVARRINHPPGKFSTSTGGPFHVTMPARVGGGFRHARGASATGGVDAARGGRFFRTLGLADEVRHRTGLEGGMLAGRKGRGAEGLPGALSAGVGGASGGGDGESDDGEWGPLAGRRASVDTEGGAAVGAAAEVVDRDDANMFGGRNNNEDDGGGGREQHAVALHRKKSVQLLRAGELSGRDPREAAKLMRGASFFVQVGGGAPLPPGHTTAYQQHRQLHRHLSRRNSDHGLTAQSSRGSFLPSSTVFRRLSRGASDEDSDATAGAPPPGVPQRRRSSMSAAAAAATTTTSAAAATGCSACPSSGGYAFSCDAKAQRAEIAMILGTRAGPMPRTASFRTKQGAPSLPRAAGEGGKKEGESNEEEEGKREPFPPLQRRSSGLAGALGLRSGTGLGFVGAGRRFSQPSALAPGDVEEGEEGGGECASDGARGADNDVEEKNGLG